jgi:tripartite-type tricarboxylate transporter receptor subunit TctC
MRKGLAALIASACLVTFAISGAAQAQQWPSRPIRLVVPTGPGLATDIIARMLADGVGRTLGVSMFVENIPGASGITGAQATAKADPDGYTFMYATASTLTTNLYTFKSLPYDPRKDFAPVARITNAGPFALAVTPSLPITSVPELIGYAKANPGKLSYAVDATSGLGIVIARLTNKRGGLGLVEVPYRSTPQMLQDVVTGTVPVLFTSVTAVEQLARAGQIRWIALSSEQRFPALSELPVIAETIPGAIVDGWFALVAPARTPEAIVNRMNAATVKFLEEDEVKKKLIFLGVSSAGNTTPQQTADFIAREQARWGEMIHEVGLQPQ